MRISESPRDQTDVSWVEWRASEDKKFTSIDQIHEFQTESETQPRERRAKGILSWVGHSRTIASQLTEDSIQGMRDSYCLSGK